MSVLETAAERAAAASPLWASALLPEPRGEARGFRTAVQARRNHVTNVAARTDPRGRAYFWIDEAQDDWQPPDGSDYQAVMDGYVAVTPLHPDLTAHAQLRHVEAFGLNETIASGKS